MSGLLVGAKRIVVKVGSSLVTDEGPGRGCPRYRGLVPPVGGFAPGLGVESVVVSSGAIAEGMKRLGWVDRPRELHALQAAAAVGQMGLAQMYGNAPAGPRRWPVRRCC